MFDAERHTSEQKQHHFCVVWAQRFLILKYSCMLPWTQVDGCWVLEQGSGRLECFQVSAPLGVLICLVLLFLHFLLPNPMFQMLHMSFWRLASSGSETSSRPFFNYVTWGVCLHPGIWILDPSKVHLIIFYGTSVFYLSKRLWLGICSLGFLRKKI